MSMPRPRMRYRLSLGEIMVLVVIGALCLVPLASAIKVGDGGLVAVVVVLEVAVFPSSASMALCAAFPPSPGRAWCIKALWMTPPVFVGAALAALVWM